ncbi:MAG: AAA family ATPase [Saprospiraceae bacterium]|nr:AAA family ATPase [Saprospiraceae bacterium]
MNSISDPFLLVRLFLKSKSGDFKEQLNELDDRIHEEIRLMARDENHLFSSIRSRLQYLLSKSLISNQLFQQILLYKEKREQGDHPSDQMFKQGIAIWLALLELESGQAIPDELAAYRQSSMDHLKSEDGQIYHPSVRISFLDFTEDQKALRFIIDQKPDTIQLLDLNCLRPKPHKHLLQCIQLLKFPIDAWAHQLRKNQTHWTVHDLVLVPDFLVDVTSIASCFHEKESNPLKLLLQFYIYRTTGVYALMGNAVNYFLDEMIIRADRDLPGMIHHVFYQNPLAFCLLSDEQIRNFSETANLHYQNIRKVITNYFDQKLKNLEECILEPSFYSVQFGIQGRLDVFYQDLNETVIVELKSGKPYAVNKFGISPDHYAQTLLYHLLINSVYQAHQDIEAYVLYSSQAINPLRKAEMQAAIKSQLIDIRNSIVAMQLHLAFHSKNDNFLTDVLDIKHFKHAEPYTRNDALTFISVYNQLNTAEKEYLKEFTGFIAREQLISKMGRSQTQYIEGLASLWLLSDAEKQNQFMLLSDLQITEIVTDPNEYPILLVETRSGTSPVANFRKGDTLVLYQQPSALEGQIFKATLIEIQSGKYRIRLRTRQFPEKLISSGKSWNMEHDFLDRSFINQYQSLLDWAQAQPEKRDLLLGIREPQNATENQIPLHQETPAALIPVLRKILNTRDYHLVWGPPGSGKTSMVIRYLTEAMVSSCGENIMLLAYTNRAVDEICEVLEWVKRVTGKDYIRIGSRYSIQEKFKSQLLDEKLKSLNGRADTIRLILETPVFVATVASIQGKKEIFELKKFDTLIVDEASQILEPQLMGLLTRFRRFILIGDHMQLPAVSTQTEIESKIQSPELQKFGMRQLDMSFFERLFNQCKENEWSQACTMLNYQGRMHMDIMKFPAKTFYSGQLEILPQNSEDRQIRAYEKLFPKVTDGIQKLLSQNRTLFVPTNFVERTTGSKTNLNEALIVCKLVELIYNIYESNGLDWNEMSLGVITPFRAQIAMIKQQWPQKLQFLENQITIDTAERYQGGARDVILLSTVITETGQMPQISSLNASGADRKLNVALTRAREQIILLGHPEALSASPHYSSLMNEFTHLDPTLLISIQPSST